jgi:hypothetical protein
MFLVQIFYMMHHYGQEDFAEMAGKKTKMISQDD